MDQSAVLSSKHAVDNGHLTASELAGYVDHALDADARRAAEEHLDRCADCRHEAMAIMNAAESYTAANVIGARARPAGPARSRSRWRRVAIGSGILAAGLLLTIVARRPNGPAEQSSTVRAPQAALGQGENVVAAAAPLDGAAIPARDAAFTWHRTTADTYRVTVLTQTGELLWSTETSDTSVALPAAVVLEPGRTYYWRVDALADGIAATSGSRRFLVAP